MIAAPVYNWTGCFVGAGGGYGMFNNQTTVVTDPGGVPIANSATHGGRGWFGTVQAGCDYQFGDRWVIGVFGDYDFANLKGDHRPGVSAGENKLDSSWAVGGRIGYVINPHLLSYFSAGYTEARFDAISLALFGAPPGFSIAERTHSGYFLGGGVEYNIGWLPGLFWKTEYRFADYDSLTTPILTIAGAPTGFAESHHPYVQTIRTELVWRWNWGPVGKGPLVARY